MELRRGEAYPPVIQQAFFAGVQQRQPCLELKQSLGCSDSCRKDGIIADGDETSLRRLDEMPYVTLLGSMAIYMTSTMLLYMVLA